jgi:hypothetical protein
MKVSLRQFLQLLNLSYEDYILTIKSTVFFYVRSDTLFPKRAPDELPVNSYRYFSVSVSHAKRIRRLSTKCGFYTTFCTLGRTLGIIFQNTDTLLNCHLVILICINRLS